MCHDFGFSAKETHAKLMKTYGDDVISYDTCKVWFAKFKKGDFTFEDAPRSGRPRQFQVPAPVLLGGGNRQAARALASSSGWRRCVLLIFWLVRFCKILKKFVAEDFVHNLITEL